MTTDSARLPCGQADNNGSTTDITMDMHDAPKAPVGDRSRLVDDQMTAQAAATEEFTSLLSASSIITSAALNTASNPVSPGSSSPSPAFVQSTRTNNTDFIPPTRPSSTPFPEPDRRDPTDYRHVSPAENSTAADESDVQTGDDEKFLVSPDVTRPAQQKGFSDLPIEIHDTILDHLFGFRVSAASKSSLGLQSAHKDWSIGLRHSRRKELSQLALVCPVWRDLVQARMFRHVKLKATFESTHRAVRFFAEHKYLQGYVKHLELWFPVFQPMFDKTNLSRPMIMPMGGLTNAMYALPIDNCSLEDVMYFIQHTFTSVHVLTLEGGERKKAPAVRLRSIAPSPDGDPNLPVLPTVRTLITKGQWNLLRADSDFQQLFMAFPSLSQWHAAYSKPKSKAYMSMATVLPELPRTLTSLHLCLEADYKREAVCPPFFAKVSKELHFCTAMAQGAKDLEHFSYTGRVCRSFFKHLAYISDARLSKLKSIDLTVKNCCRPAMHFTTDTGSGIQDMSFIMAFESLVLSAIRSMSKLRALEQLRIRFVDLASPVPPLNPYFVLRDNKCLGVWSEEILQELAVVRPAAEYEELNHSFGEVGVNKDGRLVFSPAPGASRTCFKSLKLSNYAIMAGTNVPFP